VRSSESSVVRPITKSSGIAFALVLLAAVFVVSVRELRRPKVQLVEALGFFCATHYTCLLFCARGLPAFYSFDRSR
jgi:hypothetical protein